MQDGHQVEQASLTQLLLSSESQVRHAKAQHQDEQLRRAADEDGNQAIIQRQKQQMTQMQVSCN